MLSYLHAFHAGNHADILKHAALIQVIKKLNQKSAPYSFFDTHAGSGLYSTNGEKARKTGEAARGVLALAEFFGENKKVLQAKDAAASGELSQAQDAGGRSSRLANDSSFSRKLSQAKEGAANHRLATDTGSIPKSGGQNCSQNHNAGGQNSLQDHNCGGEQKSDASLKSAALADYLTLVRPYLALDLYPGSPLIERALLRSDASHTICELHPAEFEALKENCARDFGLSADTGSKPKIAAAPRAQIIKADGFKTLLAQTPPKIKRGAVLIDPSYEESSDYEAVAKTAIAVHKKWSAGIIMIWYPLLAHRAQEIERMIGSICGAAKSQNANTNILRAEFCVDRPDSHTEMSLAENATAKAAQVLGKPSPSGARLGFANDTGSRPTIAAPQIAPRLYGSGLLVINAPWKLDEELEAALKFLAGVPGLANAPSYSVELR